MRGAPLVLLALSACNRGDPIDAQAIAAAQARWHSAALTSYRLTLEVTGDRVESGTFVVEVHDGKVTSSTRNDKPFAVHDPFYTVEGLFAFMLEEIDMAREPQRYWGGKKDAEVHQRAAFDPELGYPTKYLRAVFGTQQNIVVRVLALEAL